MRDEAIAMPQIDVDRLMTDPYGELARCSHLAAYVDGPDATGASTPWVVRHDEVRTTLRDRRLSARSFTDSMIRNGLSPQAAHQLTPLFRRDGDEHRYLRGLLAKAFTPRSVEQLRPFTGQLADRLADGIADRLGGAAETIDFVPAFAAPLPPAVFARLFGLPEEDAERLGSLGGRRWRRRSTPSRRTTTSSASRPPPTSCGPMPNRSCVPARPNRATTSISALLAAEEDGRQLGLVEVTETVSAFVFAGAETTRQQLRAMVEAFALEPDAWLRVAATHHSSRTPSRRSSGIARSFPGSPASPPSRWSSGRGR